MKKITRIVTCEEKKKFWESTVYEPQEQQDCMHVINLYPKVRYQEIEGFGGAFTEASAHNFMGMGDAKREELLQAYFGAEGLRYNIGRVHMNSCDFGLGNYTYIKEGDDTLETFDIGRDEAEILPLVQAAATMCRKRSGEEMRFLVSPWSPPAFMKTNGEMNHGGQLKKEYQKLWADYFVKFIKAYRAQGIGICALTVQNEPAAVQTWDSCVYSASEEAEFVAEYLGPALAEAGLGDIEIYIWDHNKELLFDRFSESMSSEKAASYIKGAAVHWYTGDHFEAIGMVKDAYPGAKVIFSEGCVEYSRFADTKETAKAEMYAHDMIGNLNAGISAYLDWNLFLDTLGGPNHAGNFCAAPIMCDPKEDTFEKRLSYYYIGHFSRYIQPGAVRIAATRYTSDVEVTAYLNPDKSRVAVILNRTQEPVEITLREGTTGIHASVGAHSIETYLIG